MRKNNSNNSFSCIESCLSWRESLTQPLPKAGREGGRRRSDRGEVKLFSRLCGLLALTEMIQSGATWKIYLSSCHSLAYRLRLRQRQRRLASAAENRGKLQVGWRRVKTFELLIRHASFVAEGEDYIRKLTWKKRKAKCKKKRNIWQSNGVQEGAAMRCLSLFLVMCRVPLPDLPTPPFLTLPSQVFYSTNLMSLSRPTRKQSEEPAMSRRAWNYKYYINGRSSICGLYSSWARNVLAKTICVLYTVYDCPIMCC